MKIQSFLKSKFVCSSFSALILFISYAAMAPQNSYAGEVDDILASASLQLVEKWGLSLEEVHNSVLRKYCPSEYEFIGEEMKGYKSSFPEASSDDLFSFRMALIENVLPFCEKKDQVAQLIQDFNKETTLESVTILKRIEQMLLNDEVDLPFETKKELANWIVDSEIENNLIVDKIFAKIASDHEDDSAINAEYLMNNPAVKEKLEKPLYQPSSQSDVVAEKCEVTTCKSHLVFTECKCNHKFCEKHYRPEKHHCQFDFKAEYRKELAKRLPKLTDEKIPDRI